MKTKEDYKKEFEGFKYVTPAIYRKPNKPLKEVKKAVCAICNKQKVSKNLNEHIGRYTYARYCKNPNKCKGEKAKWQFLEEAIRADNIAVEIYSKNDKKINISSLFGTVASKINKKDK